MHYLCMQNFDIYKTSYNTFVRSLLWKDTMLPYSHMDRLERGIHIQWREHLKTWDYYIEWSRCLTLKLFNIYILSPMIIHKSSK